MATELTFFDSSTEWKENPLNAFAAFLMQGGLLEPSKRDKGLRISSMRVYLAMFGKFLRWIEAKKIPLHLASDELILQFLNENGLSGGIRRRYVRLLERTFDHLRQINREDLLLQSNPARKVARMDRPGHDDPPVFLTETQQNAFMMALPSSPPRSSSNAVSWKRRRDRAMLAMMLGAGLKVSEVIGMETIMLGSAEADGSIPITVTPKSTAGTSRWHRTILRSFAAREVLEWVQLRRELSLPGKLLFPANVRGEKLNPATLYRHVKATFARAGIEPRRSGGRTLRNTFAVRELKEGKPIELVGEFLGHRKKKSTRRYVALVK